MLGTKVMCCRVWGRPTTPRRDEIYPDDDSFDYLFVLALDSYIEAAYPIMKWHGKPQRYELGMYEFQGSYHAPWRAVL